jgi:hypothetical protein
MSEAGFQNAGQLVRRQAPEQTNALVISDSKGSVIQTVRVVLDLVFKKRIFLMIYT